MIKGGSTRTVAPAVATSGEAKKSGGLEMKRVKSKKKAGYAKLGEVDDDDDDDD